MIKGLVYLFIICSLVFSSSIQNKEYALTDVQKQNIISEIEASWEISCEGIEQLDAKKSI
jgi:hypothetical protein